MPRQNHIIRFDVPYKHDHVYTYKVYDVLRDTRHGNIEFRNCLLWWKCSCSATWEYWRKFIAQVKLGSAFHSFILSGEAWERYRLWQRYRDIQWESNWITIRISENSTINSIVRRIDHLGLISRRSIPPRWHQGRWSGNNLESRLTTDRIPDLFPSCDSSWLAIRE